MVVGVVWIPGIWTGDSLRISEFLLDRYEVTNAQYQAFADAGGYERPELWEHDFVRDGQRLDFDEAMAFFVDGTGRPGPSTWEIGHFPDGTADHPVSGVSGAGAIRRSRSVKRSLCLPSTALP